MTAAAFDRMLAKPYGAVLLAGPTGSGKTTTLYTALAHINSIQRKFVTIEDPIEYTIPGHHPDRGQPEGGTDLREWPAGRCCGSTRTS